MIAGIAGCATDKWLALAVTQRDLAPSAMVYCW